MPRLWTATPIHQLPHLCPGTSRLVRPGNLRVPQHITRGAVRVQGQHPHTQLGEHCSHGSGYGHTLQSNTGKAAPVPGPQQYQGPCRRAAPAFGRLRGSQESQAGMAGCGGGHDLAMVRQKVTLRSYFFPWMVFNKHLCVRQSHPQPQGESRPTCSPSPAGTRSLARDAVLCPGELSRALGSLLQCKPDRSLHFLDAILCGKQVK